MPDNSKLSEREIEILRLVAKGASNKEIGLLLHITTNTVKVHLQNIFKKINVSSRTEAALFAINQGLVVPDGSKKETEEITLSRPDKPDDLVVSQGNLRGKALNLRRLLFLIVTLLVVLFLAYFGLSWWFDRIQLKNPQIYTERPTWQSLPELSTGRSGLILSINNNQLVVIGGRDGESVTGDTDILDLDRNVWFTAPEKPTRVEKAQASLIKDRIYVPGGMLENGEVTSRFEVFSMQDRRWEVLQPMPEARAAYAMASFNEDFYIFGGWDGTKYTDTVYRYRTGTGEWDQLKPMPVSSGYAAAVTYQGRIFLFGGRNEKGVSGRLDVFSITEERDSQGNWQRVGSLPFPRANMGAVSLVNMVFIVGGVGKDGQAFPGWVYYPENGDWKPFNAPVETAIIDPGVTGSGSNLYLVGGLINEVPDPGVYTFKAFYTALLPIVR
jgi:DNA-binding CsgD family transcriptional regulator